MSIHDEETKTIKKMVIIEIKIMLRSQTLYTLKALE